MANPNHKTSASKDKKTPVEDLVFDPKKMTFNDYIAQNAIMFLPGISTKMLTMGGLKLGLLPKLAQEYFIRWLFEVNRRRLEQGLELMVTYDIIKQCPLWKVIPMPYRNLKMTKESALELSKLIPPEKRLKFHGIK
jgi:hypothetical protein